jgi:hypothetical protein
MLQFPFPSNSTYSAEFAGFTNLPSTPPEHEVSMLAATSSQSAHAVEVSFIIQPFDSRGSGFLSPPDIVARPRMLAVAEQARHVTASERFDSPPSGNSRPAVSGQGARRCSSERSPWLQSHSPGREGLRPAEDAGWSGGNGSGNALARSRPRLVRRPAPLGPIFARTEVAQDALYYGRIRDECNHLHPPGTVRACQEIDLEDAP